MPDSRRHRSAAPGDRELFAPERLPVLREAAADHVWLLSRGYPRSSSLALVGDRFQLRARQREAIARSTCSEDRRRDRLARRVAPDALRGAAVAIDGFNLLTTVESALGGGLVLVCTDGCARDLASLGGTWRRVEETRPALERIARVLRDRGVARATWWLDAPVSNSGRLAGALRALAEELDLPWDVNVALGVDEELTRTSDLVVSADSGVLDRCGAWVNLARWTVERIPEAWAVAPLATTAANRATLARPRRPRT